MALPPIHRVDHIPCVILEDDYAWDKERIGREQAEIGKAIEDGDTSCPWPTLADHPFFRYIAGASRFDLNTVSQYLLPGQEPVRFTLRRLGFSEWKQVDHCIDQGRWVDARTLALQHGLVGIEGLDVKINIDGPLDTATIEKLRGRIGDEGLVTLGNAAVIVSREILDAEKKR
jgi:hypothetical protein